MGLEPLGFFSLGLRLRISAWDLGFEVPAFSLGYEVWGLGFRICFSSDFWQTVGWVATLVQTQEAHRLCRHVSYSQGLY